VGLESSRAGGAKPRMRLARPAWIWMRTKWSGTSS